MYTYTKHLVLVSWYWDTVVKSTVAKAHNCTRHTRKDKKIGSETGMHVSPKISSLLCLRFIKFINLQEWATQMYVV